MPVTRFLVIPGKGDVLAESSMATSNHLLSNLLLFGRILHHAGIDVTPGRMVDLADALDLVDIGLKPDFYYTVRGLLVQRREEIPVFDAAFEHFWSQRILSNMPDGSLKVQPDWQPEAPFLTSGSTLHDSAPDSADDQPDRTAIELTRVYSRREHLATINFAEMTPEEIGAVRQLLSQFVWSMGVRRTRRRAIGSSTLLDVRGTVRRNLRYGGELIELVQRQRKVKPRPLVVLADISGSMERYSRLLLHFIYSLSRGLEQPVEAFVFGTQLTRITRPLRNRDIDRALSGVAATVTDWSGGTRIGASIKAFNQQWGRRVLRGGAVVLIISDGWDRGDPVLLRTQMERLNKTCHRLVWLNPLLGSADYEPLTRGMQAALPYIDDFLPVHNVVSLEVLAEHLALLDTHKRRRVRLNGTAFIGPS